MSNVYFLGVNDTDAKLELFYEVVKYIREHNIMPELQNPDLDVYVQALMLHSMYSNTAVCRTTDSVAFTVIEEQELNPHVDGSCLILMLTLATGGTALGKLLRSVKRLAIARNHQWLYVSHRVAPCTYQSKYINLRKR